MIPTNDNLTCVFLGARQPNPELPPTTWASQPDSLATRLYMPNLEGANAPAPGQPGFLKQAWASRLGPRR